MKNKYIDFKTAGGVRDYLKGYFYISLPPVVVVVVLS